MTYHVILMSHVQSWINFSNFNKYILNYTLDYSFPEIQVSLISCTTHKFIHFIKNKINNQKQATRKPDFNHNYVKQNQKQQHQTSHLSRHLSFVLEDMTIKQQTIPFGIRFVNEDRKKMHNHLENVDTCFMVNVL